MSHFQGGQKRTIATGCGWGASGSPREVNGKIKLHIRVCEFCKGINLNDLGKHSGQTNGMNGVTVSKNGNLMKLQTQTSIASSQGTSVIINHTPRGLDEVAKALTLTNE